MFFLSYLLIFVTTVNDKLNVATLKENINNPP